MSITKTKRFLKEFDRETEQVGGADRALFLLLEDNASKLPELDDYFHEAFRKIDVTDNGRIDSAIWHLIGQSNIFWRCFEKVQPEKKGTQ